MNDHIGAHECYFEDPVARPSAAAACRRGTVGLGLWLQRRHHARRGCETEEDGDSIRTAYQTGFLRELDEEVAIDGPVKHRIVGLLYDPRTPVGAVHVGVVHIVEVEGDVEARDSSLAEARFLPLSELAGLSDRMESWSQFVIGPLSAGEL